MTSAEPNSSRFAEELLEQAEAIERAEHEIRQEVLRLARQGDVEDIERLVLRWCEGPVEKVLAQPERSPSKCQRRATRRKDAAGRPPRPPRPPGAPTA